MNITRAEKVIGLLVKNGMSEVPCDSKKYRKFVPPANPNKFYFVGKHGAVRVGPTISESRSFTHRIFS